MGLTGCMMTGNHDRFLAKFADPEPEVGNVLICHGYGCRLTDRASLSREWASLTTPFHIPAENAAEELERMAVLIAEVESIVDAGLGTDLDVGGTFAGFAQEGQLDCIDEAANTTTILTLLENDGLLHWHDVKAPMSRGFFVNGWPHTSAVVAEKDDGASYAIDSWFHPNGHPAEVVELATWLGGWSPEGTTSEQVAVSAAVSADTLGPPRTP